MEIFIKAIELVKEDLRALNSKLHSLIDKLENLIQQYGKQDFNKNISLFNYLELVSYESDTLQENLSSKIENINEKLLIEILKIKNPNENLFELMKMFFKILTEDSDKSNKEMSWLFLQSYLKSSNIKRDLEPVLSKDISKTLIDKCMPFTVKYTEQKISFMKINKNLIHILDFIKLVVEYNVKKNIVRTLYSSNLSKKEKLSKLQEEIMIKEKLIFNYPERLANMQSELTNLLTQKGSLTLYRSIIMKYNYLEKYQITNSANDNSEEMIAMENYGISQDLSSLTNPLYDNIWKIMIKIKRKYREKIAFISSIIEAKEVKKLDIIPKLKIPYVINNFENTSTRSRNIKNNIYTSNTVNDQGNNYIFTERNRETNSLSNKHKSNGSTIYRDLEALENIMKEDKQIDILPLTAAIKPLPGVGLTQRNNHRHVLSSIIIEPEPYDVNRKIDSLKLDSIKFDSLNMDKPPEFLISQEQDKIKPTQMPKENPINYNIDNQQYDYCRYFCCK